MTYKEFRHSTPEYIRLRLEAHDENVRDQNRMIQMQSWLTGTYVMAAIGATFGKAKYPENPLVAEMKSIEHIAKSNGKTEEELQNELTMATFMIHRANAQITSMSEEVEK